MNDLQKYESVLLTKNVKATFEATFIKSLFLKHRELPESDIIEFLHKAQLTGANPSLNQIFLIERNTKINNQWRKVGTVVFSYNFLQVMARHTGEYNGYKSEIKIAPKFDPNNFKPKDMLCCVLTVNRLGCEYQYTAWFDEYAQRNTDQNLNSIWSSKPYLMLEKCALAGALRRAFPEVLSGVYIEEEMNVYDHELDENKARKEALKQSNEQVKKIEESLKVEDMDEVENYMESIRSLLEQLTSGMTPNGKGNYLFENCGVLKFAEIKKKSLEDIIKIYNDLESKHIEHLKSLKKE